MSEQCTINSMYFLKHQHVNERPCCSVLFAGENASPTPIASYSGSHDGFIDLPSAYNSFNQPTVNTFPTKVSSGPAMFLDFVTDDRYTAVGIKVYVNLLLERTFMNTMYTTSQ